MALESNCILSRGVSFRSNNTLLRMSLEKADDSTIQGLILAWSKRNTGRKFSESEIHDSMLRVFCVLPIEKTSKIICDIFFKTVNASQQMQENFQPLLEGNERTPGFVRSIEMLRSLKGDEATFSFLFMRGGKVGNFLKKYNLNALIDVLRIPFSAENERDLFFSLEADVLRKILALYTEEEMSSFLRRVSDKEWHALIGKEKQKELFYKIHLIIPPDSCHLLAIFYNSLKELADSEFIKPGFWETIYEKNQDFAEKAFEYIYKRGNSWDKCEDPRKGQELLWQLDVALSMGSKKIAEMIWEKNPDLESRCPHGQNAFRIVCESQNIFNVKKFLDVFTERNPTKDLNAFLRNNLNGLHRFFSNVETQTKNLTSLLALLAAYGIDGDSIIFDPDGDDLMSSIAISFDESLLLLKFLGREKRRAALEQYGGFLTQKAMNYNAADRLNSFLKLAKAEEVDVSSFLTYKYNGVVRSASFARLPFPMNPIERAALESDSEKLQILLSYCFDCDLWEILKGEKCRSSILNSCSQTSEGIRCRELLEAQIGRLEKLYGSPQNVTEDDVNFKVEASKIPVENYPSESPIRKSNDKIISFLKRINPWRSKSRASRHVTFNC